MTHVKEQAPRVRCPKCGGRLFEKYGKTKAGKQKLRCLEPSCRRQFVAGSDRLIDAKTKETVLQLLGDDVKPPIIKKAFPKISLRWIYELRRRMPT